MVSVGILAALFGMVLAVGGRIERKAVPHPPHAARPLAVTGFGLGVVAGLFLLWLGASARPFFAATASLITLAVFVGISRVKYGYLREPLVFSDLAFIATLIRHPALFYLGRREAAGIAIFIAAVIALISVWTTQEPRLFGHGAQALILAGGVGLSALLLAGPLAQRLAALEPLRSAPAGDLVRDVGLLTTLVGGFALWRAERVRAAHSDPGPARLGDRYRAVIVIQSESFCDIRRQGVAARLEAFDRLRGRALASGRLEVSCFGAYTHRSEVEMLTGIPFAAQGMDRFDPYLRPDRLAEASLATRLRVGGWRTLFLHPHDPRFFRRDRAIPQLGFERFVAEDAYSDGDRYGPYVSDRAIARTLIREIEQAVEAGKPLFAMAVTMEAHDPYGPGRLAETDDPVAQYVRHIANTDALLGALVEALDLRTDRSLLVFYGDHAPILPGHEALADDTATDYLMLECGWAAQKDTEPTGSVDRSPAKINALLRSKLGTGRQPTTEGSGVTTETGRGTGLDEGSATPSISRSMTEK